MLTMLKITTIFWSKLKTQPDVWFFYAFLLTSSLSVRKVLFYFPIQGTFSEYAGIYIYLSDIFLTLAICLWLVILLSNKIVELSSSKHSFRLNKLNIKAYIKPKLVVDKLWTKKLIHNLYLILPLILILLSFTSILWSQNKIIALFRSLKLFEFYILYLYIIFRIVPRGTIKDKLIFIIISTGVIQSLIGIYQFIVQHSLGLTFLKESLINPEILGVAKIILNGEKYIRAYGLFPHPNILGGYLVLSIIFTLLILREHSFNKKSFIKSILCLQFIALLLTFSKSAILGLIISLGFIYWKINPKYNFSRFFKKLSQFKIAILVVIIFLTSFFLMAQPDLNSVFFQSLNERLFYLNVSRGTILANPILGIGAGQSALSIPNFTNQIIPAWQYQPVHNVFLLIWSELGIIGLILLIWWLFILNNNNCNLSSSLSRIYFNAILLGFIFIMLFDHYFWDIQQGQIMLWLVFGLMMGLQRTRSSCIV